MRFLRNDDVAAVVSPAEALVAVRRAFEAWGRGDAAVQRRERTSVGDVKLSTLGAVVVDPEDPDGGIVGAKVYSTVAPKAPLAAGQRAPTRRVSAAEGRRPDAISGAASTVGGRFTFLIALFAASDGRRLAVLEADAVTRLRTAATSTLAAQLLARPSPARLVVHGSGTQATGHVEAMVPALGIGHVTVVGRTAPIELGAKLRATLGVEVVASDDRLAGLGDADIVVTATRATGPLFPSTALGDGVFVCAVGSSRPDCRELDDDTYRRADRIVVEWRRQARDEAGGLVHAAADGAVSWDDVVELADVVTGTAPGRRHDGERIVFQSVGIGLEDVAVAAAAWRGASRQ